MTFSVQTPAFKPDGSIPRQFSRDGGNVSPLVAWKESPPGTHSFAIVVEDPDAPTGTFRHWAAYDIPAEARMLTEGAGSREQGAAVQMGINDFGNARYDGPQPPPGHPAHHYHFRLFALDVPALELDEGCTAEDVLEAARAHSLAEAESIGTFAPPA